MYIINYVSVFIVVLPSRTRYAGFFAGGDWLVQLSAFTGACVVSNSKEGSSKHLSVVPGIDLEIFSNSSGASMCVFSFDGFSVCKALAFNLLL